MSWIRVCEWISQGLMLHSTAISYFHLKRILTVIGDSFHSSANSTCDGPWYVGGKPYDWRNFTSLKNRNISCLAVHDVPASSALWGLVWKSSTCLTSHFCRSHKVGQSGGTVSSTDANLSCILDRLQIRVTLGWFDNVRHTVWHAL